MNTNHEKSIDVKNNPMAKSKRMQFLFEIWLLLWLYELNICIITIMKWQRMIIVMKAVCVVQFDSWAPSKQTA